MVNIRASALSGASFLEKYGMNAPFRLPQIYVNSKKIATLK